MDEDLQVSVAFQLSMEGGVLPRIKRASPKIGDSKANYYAVKGLTSGYH